jgi:hypothetical protein
VRNFLVQNKNLVVDEKKMDRHKIMPDKEKKDEDFGDSDNKSVRGNMASVSNIKW